MSSEDTWKALHQPVERTCINCRYDRFYCLEKLGECHGDGTKEFSSISFHDGDKWEWDGKSK